MTGESSGTGLPVGGSLLLLIGGCIGLIVGVRALAVHSSERYGWPMILNWWNLLYLLAAGAFFFMASMGREGLTAGAIVAVGLWAFMLLLNIRKTNLLTGVLMTLLQPLAVAVLWLLLGVLRVAGQGRR